MDFEKKYRITQFPGETVKAMWTRGYQVVEIYYHDTLILTHEGVNKLRNGVKYQTKELGEIELKLSAKPITLDIIIDGYHCVNNVSHPAKELKSMSTFFWVITIFAIISSLLDGIHLSFDLSLGSLITLINLSVVTVYVVSAVNTNKSKPWAFYLGLSMFGFWTLISLLSLVSGNIFIIMVFLIRVAFLVFLIKNIKYAVATAKHNQFNSGGNRTSEDLLDSKI